MRVHFTDIFSGPRKVLIRDTVEEATNKLPVREDDILCLLESEREARRLR